MNKIINILCIFLPSFIQVSLRRLFKQKIGKGTKIGIGSLIHAKSIEIGNGVTIGSFSLIYAQKISIGSNSSIKSFAFIKTRIVHLKKYVHIANFSFINSGFFKNSSIFIGNHSRIFPFCWLDTGEGIKIGNHVGIGGFTLIFTHSVWTNYLKGGPIAYKPVVIEDEVWLPWRVFIMPGVTIKKQSIVGANSLVSRDVPRNTLVAGSPAKIIKENIITEPNNEEKNRRLHKIIDDFIDYMIFKNKINPRYTKTKDFYLINETYFINTNNKKGTKGIVFGKIPNSIDANFSFIDLDNLEILIAKKDDICKEFFPFLRRYGIRLTKK